MTDIASRSYIHWDAPGAEKIPSGEADDIQAVADMINAIQRTRYNRARHAYGGEMFFLKNPGSRMLA